MHRGDCRDACEGNECPGAKRVSMVFVSTLDVLECEYGERCADGVCFNPCEMMTCDEGEVCAEGVCGPEDCQHTGCPDGERCAPPCVVDPCFEVECPRGEFCREGRCIESAPSSAVR